MYTNTRRRKRSMRNINQDLWRYVTWIQTSSRNTLYWHTTTASLGFVLSILSSSWTTSKPILELSYQKNYKRMIFHWMHNGTRHSHCSNIHSHWRMKDIFQSWRRAIHWEKYHLLYIPFHGRLWIVQPVMWYLTRQALKRHIWSNSKLFFPKKAANIKHHTTGSVGINDKAVSVILQLRK